MCEEETLLNKDSDTKADSSSMKTSAYANTNSLLTIMAENW